MVLETLSVIVGISMHVYPPHRDMSRNASGVWGGADFYGSFAAHHPGPGFPRAHQFCGADTSRPNARFSKSFLARPRRPESRQKCAESRAPRGLGPTKFSAKKCSPLFFFGREHFSKIFFVKYFKNIFDRFIIFKNFGCGLS